MRHRSHGTQPVRRRVRARLNSASVASNSQEASGVHEWGYAGIALEACVDPGRLPRNLHDGC
jgi:hypothetical protein